VEEIARRKQVSYTSWEDTIVEYKRFNHSPFNLDKAAVKKCIRSIPNGVLKPGVKQFLYSILAEFFNFKTGQCNPSGKTIVDIWGFSERTIKRKVSSVLQELKGHVFSCLYRPTRANNRRNFIIDWIGLFSYLRKTTREFTENSAWDYPEGYGKLFPEVDLIKSPTISSGDNIDTMLNHKENPNSSTISSGVKIDTMRNYRENQKKCPNSPTISSGDNVGPVRKNILYIEEGKKEGCVHAKFAEPHFAWEENPTGDCLVPHEESIEEKNDNIPVDRDSAADFLQDEVFSKFFRIKELKEPELYFHSIDRCRDIERLRKELEIVKEKMKGRRPVGFYKPLDENAKRFVSLPGDDEWDDDDKPAEKPPEEDKFMKLKIASCPNRLSPAPEAAEYKTELERKIASLLKKPFVTARIPRYYKFEKILREEGETALVKRYFRIAHIQIDYPNWKSIVARERCKGLGDLQYRMWMNLDYDPLDKTMFSGFDPDCFVEYGLYDEESRNQIFLGRVLYWFGIDSNRKLSPRSIKILAKARRMADESDAYYDWWIKAQVWKHGEHVLFTNLISKRSLEDYQEFAHFQPDIKPLVRQPREDFAGHQRNKVLSSTHDVRRNVGHLMDEILNRVTQ
jgi:hypothetical protein